MDKNFKILLVDDEEKYRNVLSRILRSKGYHVDTAPSGEFAINMIKDNNYNLVLTDLVMKKVGGLKLLEFIKKYDPSLEVIIITGYGSVKNAVEAMKMGCFSYYIKTKDPDELLLEIEKVQKMENLILENSYLKYSKTDYSFMLDTKNEKFKNTIKIAKKAARSNSNILIIGESGVGKEILAKYIHMNSSRRNKQFVHLNCHAYSDTLLGPKIIGGTNENGEENNRVHINKFTNANKGTLFLDEIGELSLKTQIELLKVLENMVIERPEFDEMIELDFRLIATTNKKIQGAIKEEKFRKDLYYRISTIKLEIPPLRERREDLPNLINYFVNISAEEQKKDIYKIDDEVMDYLLNYDYPGNIRELKNIIERLVVLSEKGVINSNYLETQKSKKDLNEKEMTLREFREINEKEYIKELLETNDGNVTKTAKILDISRRQLYNKINKYNI